MFGFEANTIDRNDAERTMFLIPEANMPRLEREIAKLSKKAKRWHDWSFDALVVGFRFEDRKGHKVKLLEVCLDVETIQIDGWRFIARIDHSPETGNVLRAVPNADTLIHPRFRTAAPDCEHCNHKRARRDTFVLYNAETNQYKQVGSTCLVDFLGHDARDLGRIAEFASYATEAARAAEASDESLGITDRRYVEMDSWMQHCAAMVRTKGWVSAKAARENEALTSTREAASENMYHAWKNPAMAEPITPADVTLAEKALEWAQSFADKDTLTDYEHNVLVIANASVIEYRSCGIAASIVGVYDMKFTPRAPRAQKANLGDMSEVIALFDRAGSRLKNPKIRIDIAGTDVVMSVAGPRAKNPGTINLASPGSFGENTFYGRIHRDGRFEPAYKAPTGIEKGLMDFAAAPAKVAAQHGHKTGQCCFCAKGLTDARSTNVGYGATCAANYGLPWGVAA